MHAATNAAKIFFAQFLCFCSSTPEAFMYFLNVKRSPFSVSPFSLSSASNLVVAVVEGGGEKRERRKTYGTFGLL